MSAGCISFEADVHLLEGDAIIGHDSPQAGRSLSAQYIHPLRAILDHNNDDKPGTIMLYPARPGQSVTLVVDFKSSEPELFGVVLEALQPLRDGAYLSTSKSGEFVQKHVTIVLGGSAPFDRIDSDDDNPNRDVFYGAPSDHWDSKYTSLNSFYASQDWTTVEGFDWLGAAMNGGDNPVSKQAKVVHDAGLRLTYCRSM